MKEQTKTGGTLTRLRVVLAPIFTLVIAMMFMMPLVKQARAGDGLGCTPEGQPCTSATFCCAGTTCQGMNGTGLGGTCSAGIGGGSPDGSSCTYNMDCTNNNCNCGMCGGPCGGPGGGMGGGGCSSNADCDYGLVCSWVYNQCWPTYF